jgi:hypothetical protein
MYKPADVTVSFDNIRVERIDNRWFWKIVDVPAIRGQANDIYNGIYANGSASSARDAYAAATTALVQLNDPESLRNLVENVKHLKATLSHLRAKEGSTKENENLVINQIYDAVFLLNRFFHQKIGIYGSQLAELCRDNGYVIGKDIPLPRYLENE